MDRPYRVPQPGKFKTPFFITGHFRVLVRLIVPPTQNALAKYRIDPEPGAFAVEVPGTNKLLKEILVFRMELPRPEDVVEGRRIQDNSGPPSRRICRFDHERLTEMAELIRCDMNFPGKAVGRKNDRVRNVQTVREKFQMHRRFIDGVGHPVIRINDANVFPVEQFHKGKEGLVDIRRPVIETMEGKIPALYATDDILKVMRRNLVCRNVPFMTFVFDAADEIIVKFPFPSYCQPERMHDDYMLLCFMAP